MQDPMIEKYRQELMEFSRKNPRFSGQNNRSQNRQPPQETQPAERIRPNGNLYRADFEAEQAKQNEERKRRLENTAKREQVCEEAIPAAAAEDTPDNPREIAFSDPGESLPPYNNGNIVEYETQDAFLAANPRMGFLRVQVSAADQAFPIQNAEITVSKHFKKSDSVFFTDRTDASGIMSRISLPAPDRSLASAPSALQPYATYDVCVSHYGFSEVFLKNCVIFDGIETIQQVELIPTVEEDNAPLNAEGGE